MPIADAIASMRGICIRWPRWKVNNRRKNSVSTPVKWKTLDSLIWAVSYLRHSLISHQLDGFISIHCTSTIRIFFVFLIIHAMRIAMRIFYCFENEWNLLKIFLAIIYFYEENIKFFIYIIKKFIEIIHIFFLYFSFY